MIKEKLGVWLFAGVIGVTGIVSSGKIVDVNSWLDQLRPENMSVQTPVTKAEAENIIEQPVEPALEQVKTVEPKPMVEEVDAMQETVALAPDILPQLSTPPSIDITPAAKDEAQQAGINAAVEATVQAIQTPTFDILRVEPNGSMLIAGLAAPSSDIDLIFGSQSLTTTKTNKRGEFVAILDEPLSPGDYQIVLRSTTEEGASATSAETAIVSIPAAGSNDVLALVEAPGAPSRLITQQLAQKPEPVVEPEPEMAVKEKEDAPEEFEIAKAPIIDNKPEQTVTVAPKVAAEIAKSVKTSAPKIRIEAVEIDGPTVFVAGKADAGSHVRIYANDILLGDAIANPDGSFLIEVNRDLPVGDYVIRADVLGRNSVDVLSRAAVPFARQEGEKIAAVAVPVEPEKNETPVVAVTPNKTVKQEMVESAPSTDETNKPVVEIAKSPLGVLDDAPEIEIAALDGSDKTDRVDLNGNINERLAPSNESVIIRRGDTLWQISRRVYGRGIKYTTIYKANDAQIKDPNRIWPGQIFDLPEGEEAAKLENAEN